MRGTNRPLVKRHGGKFHVARAINGLMPGRRVYVEPFLGGGSVVLNRASAPVEVLNDAWPPLAALWRAVAGPEFPAFYEQVKAVEYTRETFRAAGPSTPLGYLIKCRMSRGGLGVDFAIGGRERGGRPGDVNGWHTFVEDVLPAIHGRVRTAAVRCQDALELVREFDGQDALVYLDPPYLADARTAKECYELELSDVRHQALLEACLRSRAKIFISGYRSRMYDVMLHRWRRHDLTVKNSAGQGAVKQARVECLWERPD